jgi:hypothetical protein
MPRVSADAIQPSRQRDPSVRLGSCAAPRLIQIREFAASRGWQSFAPFLYYAYGTPGAGVLIGAEAVEQLHECLAEWALVSERYQAVRELAARIRVLPERVLNPWQW